MSPLEDFIGIVEDVASIEAVDAVVNMCTEREDCQVVPVTEIKHTRHKTQRQYSYQEHPLKAGGVYGEIISTPSESSFL